MLMSFKQRVWGEEGRKEGRDEANHLDFDTQ